MKTERILLPVDLAKHPVDALLMVNGLAEHSDATVILLHVVHLNILVPEGRIYEEVCRDAERQLEELARRYLHPAVKVSSRVRVGTVFNEIVAEAGAQQADLILLPTFPISTWKRFFVRLAETLAEKLARCAPCPILAVQVETPFQHEKYWNLENLALANVLSPERNALFFATADGASPG